MSLGWGVAGFGLAPAVVERALGAVAGHAVMVWLLRGCRGLRLATFEPLAGDGEAIFNSAVRVANVRYRHTQLPMCPEPPHRVAAKEQAVS
jgi:hypothetical protein